MITAGSSLPFHFFLFLLLSSSSVFFSFFLRDQFPWPAVGADQGATRVVTLTSPDSTAPGGKGVGGASAAKGAAGAHTHTQINKHRRMPRWGSRVHVSVSPWWRLCDSLHLHKPHWLSVGMTSELVDVHTSTYMHTSVHTVCAHAHARCMH